MKRYWDLIVFGSIQAIILLVLFNSGIYHNSTMQHDVTRFFEYSSRIIDGQLPYRDFTVEYPPIALIFFTLPRLIAYSVGAYQWAFTVEILIFSLLGLYLLSRLSRNLGIPSAVTLSLYTVLILGIGPLMTRRYDLIPAVIVLASIYAFSRQKYRLSWVILAMAVMTKIYPLVIAPLFILYHLSRNRLRDSLQGATLFSLAIAVISLPCLLLSIGGFWNSFSMQMHRGLHVESLYSSILLLAQNMGLTQVRIQTIGPTPLSVNAVSPLADIMVKISPWVMALTLIFLYWLFYKRNRKIITFPSSAGTADLINYSFLAVLVFLLTNTVFSPQYLIWLLPLASLVTGRGRYVSWLALIIAGVFTYYLYPMHYNSFMKGDSGMVYILLFRNLILLFLIIWLIDWKQSAEVQSGISQVRLYLKPYMMALVLVIALGSIMYIQFDWNSHSLPSETSNGLPGGRTNDRYQGTAPQNGSNRGFPGGNMPEDERGISPPLGQ